MHDMFPDWLRTINPEYDVSSMPLEQWWSAITAFVTSADPGLIVDLCRAAHERPNLVFDEQWRQHLRSFDPVSPLRAQDRQISVLAGAALIHATQTGSHPQVAQYARRCASHLGWKPSLPDAAFSGAEFHQAAEQVRSLREWPPPRKVTVTTRNVASHVPTSTSAVTGADLEAVVDALASSVTDAVSRSANSIVKVAAERERVLLEQSDILVWLLSGHSSLLKVAWTDLPRLTAAACAAAEVQGLSRFPFGRPDSTALIGHTVASAAELTETHVQDEQVLRSLKEHCSRSTSIGVADLTPLLVQVSAAGDIDLSAEEFGVRLHDELWLVTCCEPAE